MTTPIPFDLQGHRGARGLKPENTLPSVEVACDLGVSSIELDLQVTLDGVVVVYHDQHLNPRQCRAVPGRPLAEPGNRPAIETLSLQQLRDYAADLNPDPERFPQQDAMVTPLAQLFAAHRDVHPYTPPTLTEVLAFVAAYSGPLGERAGKSAAQRKRAGVIRLDLELKHRPFTSCADVDETGHFEREVVAAVRAAGMLGRTSVRSFDHRLVRRLRRLEPQLRGAVLIAETVPVDPVAVVRAAEAETYCPSYDAVDGPLVRELHGAGIRVVPWTVNNREDLERLLDWGVDGITTDFPDRLAVVLGRRGIAW
ncbi:MAG: hypothetical protein NZ700_07190 [Gemmataceae bacterium]|nr:hypothetical protein [Gemmataceae bacterium]MDW8266724.1 glycerophosphodiester phosphodiesterase family protein [Gemmataceae bacterium]